MKKIEQQLNNILDFAKKQKLTNEQIDEINKIGFLYSCDRMSPLEVALRMWYVICNNVDGIYGESFQNFAKETIR